MYQNQLMAPMRWPSICPRQINFAVSTWFGSSFPPGTIFPSCGNNSEPYVTEAIAQPCAGQKDKGVVKHLSSECTAGLGNLSKTVIATRVTNFGLLGREGVVLRLEQLQRPV